MEREQGKISHKEVGAFCFACGLYNIYCLICIVCVTAIGSAMFYYTIINSNEHNFRNRIDVYYKHITAIFFLARFTFSI